MVSEAKKAVFGIQVDERPAENQIQARSNIQNVLNLVGALIVLYVYVAFYAIPRYVLLKAVALAQTLLASNCASAYSAKAKGRYQELKNTWSPKLQSLLVRAQDYTLYTLAEKVYQKALVPAIQNLISVAHLIIEKVQVLLVRATQIVEWAFQTLSNVKQQVLASTLVVKGVQFSNTVATRALLIYETKLLALWAFAKQVVIGKLGKRFTIVEQKAEPVATVAPLQEEQRAEQVAAPIVPQQQPQESQPQQAEKVDAAPVAQEPVARKLQFEDEPAVEAKAEPSEEPIVKEAEVQEPLLQPAPASAPAHEEEQQDALSSPRKQDAADEAHDDQHLSPSKAKHGRKHKHTKKK